MKQHKLKLSRNEYTWPLPCSAVIERIVDNAVSHVGPLKGAIDIAVAVGTPVLAARPGRVIHMRDGSREYGVDRSYSDKANSVTIQHDNEEWSEYVHLESGLIINVGQVVKAGDIIGYTGLSGWMTAPHLHFIVACRSTVYEQGFEGVYPKFDPLPLVYSDLVGNSGYKDAPKNV